MFPFSAVTSQQHLKVLSHKEARDERALRRRRRQLLEDGHESKQSETNNEVSSPLVSASVILDRKSQMQTTSSVQPHSQTNNSSPESPASAGEVFVSNFTHGTRESNLSNSSINQKPQINFPASGDEKTWKRLNEQLALDLPSAFSDYKIAKTPIKRLADEFDDFLHQYFFGEFGEKTVAPTNKAYVQRPHKGLEKLRKQKQDLKKARKALRKANLEGSDADIQLKQRWCSLVRKHSRLSAAVREKNRARFSAAQQRQFKKDPYSFGTKLFKNTDKSAAPTFTEKEATEYFSRTYQDTERSHRYEPLPGMKRPKAPNFLFELRCPTLSEVRKSVRCKRNGAAAGLNSLTYVPYKKCPAIWTILTKLFRKVWQTRTVPDSWASAFIVLISKSDKVHLPAEFRPIAITNTVGKILFSIISARLEHYMVSNKFIDNTIQKGFLSEMPGCLEHAFTLYEFLRDAKREQRQIVVTWIDLANAYGVII